MKTIIGQLSKVSGTVFLDGKAMEAHSRNEIARRMAILMTARMEEPLHILPGSMDMDSALTLEGTKVLMKSGRAIRETVDALERHGLAARAGMVADCGLETEQVYTDLRQLPEEISYFATIVAD